MAEGADLKVKFVAVNKTLPETGREFVDRKVGGFSEGTSGFIFVQWVSQPDL